MHISGQGYVLVHIEEIKEAMDMIPVDILRVAESRIAKAHVSVIFGMTTILVGGSPHSGTPLPSKFFTVLTYEDYV